MTRVPPSSIPHRSRPCILYHWPCSTPGPLCPAMGVMEATAVGEASTMGAHIGPVVNKAQFDKIQGLIQSAIDEGATLVTGGTGFLGRRLVERLLAAGRPVTVLARRADPTLTAHGVRFITASLDDTAAVTAACAGHATIFHTAAKVGVWGRYDDFYRTNVLGTRAILAGCRAHGVTRLVYTSTPSVVYNGHSLANADESLPLTTSCPSPYPLTKALAEQEVLAANSPTLRTVALRPHLIWGVGDPHLVPRVLARARAGRLRIVGDGLNRVDMVHVENAVDAHLAAESALSGP
eukprot:gene13515-17951_t